MKSRLYVFIVAAMFLSHGQAPAADRPPMTPMEKEATFQLEDTEAEMMWTSYSILAFYSLESPACPGWSFFLDKKYKEMDDDCCRQEVDTDRDDTVIVLDDVLPVRRFRKLRHVSLIGSEVTPEAIDFILKNTQLYSLSIEGYAFRDEDVAKLAKYQKSLHGLHLEFAGDFSQKGIDELRKLPALVSLVMDVPETEQESRYRFQGFALRELEIHCQRRDDEQAGGGVLFDLFRKEQQEAGPQPGEDEMSEEEENAETVREIGRFLSRFSRHITVEQCPELRKLVIWGEHLQQIFTLVEALPKLDWLVVHTPFFMDAESRQFLAADVPLLRSLELRLGEITRDDLQFLTDIPTDHFVEISLESGEITPAALAVLWGLKPVHDGKPAAGKFRTAKLCIDSADDYTPADFQDMTRISVDAIDFGTLSLKYRIHQGLIYHYGYKQWKKIGPEMAPEEHKRELKQLQLLPKSLYAHWFESPQS